MAFRKKTPPSAASSPRALGRRKNGIRISITNQHGQRYCYKAHAVNFSMRNGKLQVVENGERCFLWFDQCDLEVHDVSGNLVFHLQAGAASNQPNAELVILAELTPSMPRRVVRRPTLPPAAVPLAI